MNTLIDNIKSAFKNTPYPGSEYSDISATRYDDEGVHQYFKNSDQFEHSVEDLRYHSCALSFFTDAAFRYWLPAFMLAELRDPEEADIIADTIAFSLYTSGAHQRISSFSDSELIAVKEFLFECTRRYDDEISSEPFMKALSKIQQFETHTKN
ncbi:DUF6714 family protein [Rubritalea tangerina]|uniref:DUF6714 family protein n=1 Tax=Rubritalea tangerina TaxID=430798 RepID=A0ABW4ZB49_9BACT